MQTKRSNCVKMCEIFEIVFFFNFLLQADKDGNKGIDQSEFAELWNALHGGGEAEAKIREEFTKLDADKSGFISKDEMLAVISGSFTGDKQAEAQRCVAELDVDKDGRVSYPEFLLVMKYKKA